ncbi:hypothetical protein ACQ4PT_003846 [Festuca glaucescens]
MLGSSWTTPVDSSDWIGMEKEVTTPWPEAMVLLNCAVENPYDRDKCLSLLDALRECIAQKYAWMEAYQVTMCTEDLDQGQTIGLSTWRVKANNGKGWGDAATEEPEEVPTWGAPVAVADSYGHLSHQGSFDPTSLQQDYQRRLLLGIGGES